jgi:sorbitol-specific phosphotransferase system component IIA
VLSGRASVDLPAGTVLKMGGHHHDVTGVQAVLVTREAAPADIAPLYLAAHARLASDVKAGALLTLADLADYNDELLAAWNTGFAER